jgi:ferredoxin--NADP+ reductase/benzoate/toluate 1,2-dioxygenase reductase subunit
MDLKSNINTQNAVLKVRSIRELTPSAYVLQFDRLKVPFRAGQHILLGKKGDIQAREYSIYSAEQEDFFEVLIKEVQEGMVSKQLKRMKTGEPVNFESPVGYFTLKDEDIQSRKFLFIASGTGIAPFHSFVKSYPGLNYKLLHGVRFANEAYEKETYDKGRLVLCTSRDKKGDYFGRVTDYLHAHPIEDKNTLCYFCGNCEMIHEAYDILLKQGVPSENLFAEVYF